jgi:ATP-dependent Lon protease
MNYNRLEDRYDEYDSDTPKNSKKNKVSPFEIEELTPIQLPHMDMQEFFDGRRQFTKEEWIDVLLRSIGMEPTQFETRVKWHLLERIVPLVENNYNLCELGPRGTGKSHVYKEISPNSILISGGQTTVANLFYNMANRTIGLVGMWDCVAFDEVAGITFKDKDGVQIMKDFMASGSFARGKEEKNANASMVFVGNINKSIDVLMKTSHLFEPFPEAIAYDSAFFDRMHYYLPGWEIPKMRPEFFTNEYGFITDYLAEFMREMRKRSFGDAIEQHFRLGGDLNQRDVIAVRKSVSGLLKLLYPHGEFNRDDVAEVLQYALEGRRRVKEQLKKIGGMEFYDVHFSYLDNDSFEEHFVSVPEQGSSKLIPEGQGKPGHVYTVARGDTGMLGVYKLETELVGGNGKFEVTGVGYDNEAKENLRTAQNYFKANKKTVSGSINIDNSNFLMHIADCQGIGTTPDLALCAFVALCGASLRKPIQSQMCILGNMSIGGTISKVEELANTMQVCFDAGAKKILLPMSSAVDIASVPADLFAKFQTSFYMSPEDAVFKALGLE